jgi:hypothetical protein
MGQPYKSITTTRRTPEEPQVRDTYQTPNYAIDLLIPFIPKDIKYIWECAAGGGKISNRLCDNGYVVVSTDIRDKKTPNNDNEIFYNYNFLTERNKPIPDALGEWFQNDKKIAIITNPPFSVKDLFVEMAFSYNFPFAFLINADYSQQAIDWIRRGCQKIVPTSRIAYITPNILRRIHEGEVWKIEKEGRDISNLEEYKREQPSAWKTMLETYSWCHNYSSLDEVPQELLYQYSSAQFHSMWLTYGFELKSSEVFVDLDVQTRKENI